MHFIIEFSNGIVQLSCNQVDDIAGNEDSPTKQARGDSSKERKLHRWQNGEKTLGETRLSRGPVPLRPDESVVCSNCSKVRV